MASSPPPYSANTDQDRRRILDAVAVAPPAELFPPEIFSAASDEPPLMRPTDGGVMVGHPGHG